MSARPDRAARSARMSTLPVEAGRAYCIHEAEDRA